MSNEKTDQIASLLKEVLIDINVLSREWWTVFDGV